MREGTAEERTVIWITCENCGIGLTPKAAVPHALRCILEGEDSTMIRVRVRVLTAQEWEERERATP